MTRRPFLQKLTASRRRLTVNPSLPVRTVAALVLLALLLSACADDGRPAARAPTAPLGGAVLVDRTPEQFEADLAALRGRVVVVNFWASWCAPCRRELPALQRVSRELADQPVSFIGVDSNDQRPAGLALLRELGVTFPTVFDRDPANGIMSSWGIASLPETRFFAKDGTFAGREPRALEPAALRERIRELLAG
jgi:thiol-disulfide isomerase/thioredoxin